jgi:hypothetical protein
MHPAQQSAELLTFAAMALRTLSLLLSLILLPASCLLAQDDDGEKSKKTEGNRIWTLDLNGGVDFPAADMAERFGTSWRIGPAIKFKTASNWIFGARFDFLTGNKMRDDSLLYNLRTSQGGIVAQNGDVLNPGLFLRGYQCGISVGKIFPVLQLNANSGPFMMASTGFIQYKINIFDRDNSFPQLRDDYKKGYDRLTNGWYLEDFIGYMYFAKNKLINFYAGFNIMSGFTQGRRDYQLDLGRPDTGSRNDILTGFRVGWVLPIYRKNAEETYY